MAAGTAIVDKIRLGDSATDSQNFILKTNNDGTLLLARGATGSLGNILSVDSSGNITVLTQANTDNSTRIASTAFARSITTGIGQTWQNMFSTRALTTTYTNNTGQGIHIMVGGATVNPGGYFVVTVGGVSLPTTWTDSGSVPCSTGLIFIPAGATYSVAASSATYTSWVELRA